MSFTQSIVNMYNECIYDIVLYLIDYLLLI